MTNNGLLKDFPPPLPGKTGWPWTEESKPLPQLMPNGNAWPKITIVTPSYNQGQFLEETIRSVLLQNYPNLEYIIMDGGSTDNSIDIIKRYEPWLACWISEKDNGQAAAISKGFEKATGQYIGWLNSDDYLLPNALKIVCRTFARDAAIEFIVGGGLVVDAGGSVIRKYYSYPQSFISLLSIGQFFMQMSTIWKREAYLAVGGIDTSLRFCFDYDLFLRLTKRKGPYKIKSLLSVFRTHDRSKSATIWETVGLQEFEAIRDRYGYYLWSQSERDERVAYYTRQYHMNKRWGILEDAFRDSDYFRKALKNKIRSELLLKSWSQGK